MTLVRTLLFIGLLLSGGACDGGSDPAGMQTATVPEEAKAALARARDLYLAEDSVQAAQELRHAVALAPDWAEARLQLGKLLLTLCSVRFSTATFDRGCLDQAVMELERACTLDPKSAEAAYWTGRAFGKVPNIPVAKTWLETALRLDPNHGLALKELGLLLSQEGDVTRSKEYLTRARQQLPNDDEVQLQLGMLLESEDDLEAAKAALLRASELNPGHPGPLTGLVRIYRRQGDESSAVKTEEALARCKEWGKRLTQTQQRFEANKLDSAACFEVAKLYDEMGMGATARSWAERALRLDANNAAASGLLKKLGGGAKKDAGDFVNGSGAQ